MPPFVQLWISGFGRRQKVSPAKLIYPVLHTVAHRNYVAVGGVCERPERVGRRGLRNGRSGLGFRRAPGVCLGRSAVRDVA